MCAIAVALHGTSKRSPCAGAEGFENVSEGGLWTTIIRSKSVQVVGNCHKFKVRFHFFGWFQGSEKTE